MEVKRLITAFLSMIRWTNLVFILLTQALFYYCIDLPLDIQPFPLSRMIWLMAASVFIAAAGYIINDYFDLNIDRINKPGKNVIDHVISRRWAIFWHLTLSVMGIIATLVAVSFHKWYLVIANAVCVLLLWLYSTSFKRQYLIGNIVISLLTAWTVLVIFFAEVPFSAAFGAHTYSVTRFFKAAFLYGGFAFIISLIREALKDVQDIKGDIRYGCKTLPIVSGIHATKIYIGVWLVVLIAALLILQLYMLQLNWWLAIFYSIFFVILPLLYLFYKLWKAKTTKEFAYLSGLAKLIMLTGIITMVFFKVYF